mgnify:CR=1 FL=1
MGYIVVILVLIVIVIQYLNYKRNMELLSSVSTPERGTRAERRLIIKLQKLGVHPKAIFHDLYLQKNNGEYTQIDLIVATPQGLITIEVKDYSGWIFGNENQKYWTQLLNYGKEKYRFYNPIKQNEGHIKALQEQSLQFANLPIFNVVLFAGNCTLKDVTYISANTYVGYDNDIAYILNKISELDLAVYTDKREVASSLRRAVNNGDNQEIVSNHLFTTRRNSVGTPPPKIDYTIDIFRFNRRLFRF